MSSRYQEGDYDRDRANYGRRQQERYGRSRAEQSRGQRTYNDRENEGYGRGRGSAEYAWSEGRGWESGREDYGSGSWEGEGEAWGERNRPYRNDYRDQEYRSQRYPHYGVGRAGLPEYGRDYDRGEYDRGNERNWWDRTSDEVASWFGDEEAERRRCMDQQRSHRGRGPKGYTRSDDRIREDVNDRLSDDYYLDASDIEVMVESAEVTLTGTVNTRNDKRRAEDLAESVSGVRNVENRLRIGQNQNVSTTLGTTDSSPTATARGRSATT